MMSRRKSGILPSRGCPRGPGAVRRFAVSTIAAAPVWHGFHPNPRSPDCSLKPGASPAGSARSADECREIARGLRYTSWEQAGGEVDWMSPEENKAVVLRLLDELFVRRNASIFDEIASPDLDFYLAGYAEPFRGIEAVKAWAVSYFAA